MYQCCWEDYYVIMVLCKLLPLTVFVDREAVLGSAG